MKSRDTIRVILIAPPLSTVGGQSVQAARLLEEIAKCPGVEVNLLPASLPESLGFLRRVPLVRTAAAMICFHAQLLKRIVNSDILHVFTAAYFSFLWIPAPSLVLARLSGRKSILNYRDGRGEAHLRDWKSARRLVGLADALVSPSRYLVDVFAGHGLAATCIPNVIDAGRFRFRERGPLKPVFLHNRGFETLYNVPCTLRAFALVQQKYPKASLILAHDGPLRAEIERLAESLGLRNVSFVGQVSQRAMAKLYDQADIYWMSPDVDCMPGSLLEAFAAGLPLISTNAGGVPHMVTDGETGLLVDRNDHQSMAQAALRLLGDEALVRHLTTKARSELAKYQGEVIARQWAELYRELAGRG